MAKRERKRENNEKYDIIKKNTAICFCLSRALCIGNKSHTPQCISYAKCSKKRERERRVGGAGDFRDMNTMPIAFVTRLKWNTSQQGSTSS